MELRRQLGRSVLRLIVCEEGHRSCPEAGCASVPIIPFLLEMTEV